MKSSRLFLKLNANLNNKFVSLKGNLLSNTTQIIIRGSVRACTESTHAAKTYKAGEVLGTNIEHSESPAPKYFQTSPPRRVNYRRLLVQYTADTLTLEYNRSFFPLWFFTSFIENILRADFETFLRLAFQCTKCAAMVVEEYAKSLLDLSQECCSNNFLKLYN